jgi:DOPA 4,5-dioxygenase
MGVDIYFHQKNKEETAAALALRDAILRLRHEGAFIAVPLVSVNTNPLGPHPVGELRLSCFGMSLVDFAWRFV